MKRIALLAAVVLFAACAPKADEAPAMEEAAPAADTAAVTTDSAAVTTDSAAKPM